MENRIERQFFARKPDKVAKNLLGKLLIARINNEYRVGKIVETEAYFGKNDTACHASSGKTKRNEVMFGSAGRAYVYLIYGMYFCLNIVTEKENVPSAVLIRAVEPVHPKIKEPLSSLRKETAGPGRLCRWFGIDRDLNGENV